MVGAVDVLEELRNRNRVEVVHEHIGEDGTPSSFVLLYGHYKLYYLGPVPLGPYPMAVFSGVAFVASIMAWSLSGRGKKRTD
jgi:hypothetical protein